LGVFAQDRVQLLDGGQAEPYFRRPATMPNPVQGSNQPKVEVVSDLAAAQREVDAYLGRLSAGAVEPEAQLPVNLDKNRAADAFKTWLNSLSLVPGDLKTSAHLGELKPIAIPFWVVNSMTYSSYTGEKGSNYKTTESVEQNGQMVNKEVTRTSWNYAHGEVKQLFDRVILVAGGNLSDAHVKLLQPADPGRLQSYNPGSLQGFAVAKHNVDPKACFNKARSWMEAEIKKLVEKDIGGDQRKVAKVETRHTGVSLKLALAPAYQGSFTYKGKTYPVLINATTGAVEGEYPVSAGKVALVVLIFLLIFAAIGGALYWFVVRPAMSHHAEAPRPAIVQTAKLNQLAWTFPAGPEVEEGGWR
jgi:hypothetical protein